MKSIYNTILFCVLLSISQAFAFAPSHSNAHRHGIQVASTVTSSPSRSSRSSNRSSSSSTRLYFFGAKKDDGSPGDYVCKDCGYVFTKGPKAWAALDDAKYACPPCGAPKFRFDKVPKGSASGTVKVKKSWF